MTPRLSISVFLWLATGLVLAGLAIWQLDPRDARVVGRTLALGTGTGLLAVPLAASVFAAARRSGCLPWLLRISLLALLGLPVIIQAAAWDSAFGKLGWWTATQGQVLEPVWNRWTAAIWIHAIALIPQLALIFWLMDSLDSRSWQEHASLEGDRLSVFWHITLPHWLPIGLVAMLWSLIATSREIAVTDLYQIGTLAEQIYLGFALGPLAGETDPTLTRWGGLAGSGVGMTLALVGWSAVGLVVVFHWGLATTRESNTRVRGKPPVAGPGFSILAVGWWILLIAVPFYNLVARARFQVEIVDGEPQPTYSWSAAGSAIRRAITDQADAFQWSFLIGFGSVVVLLVLGIATSWLARRRRWLRFAWVISLAVAAACPGPLIGSGLSSLFSRLENPGWQWLYNNTILAPLIANAVFCWPLAGLLVWMVVTDQDDDAAEHARLEGASSFQRLWQFAILNHGPQWLGCGLIILAVSCGELSASRMVLPPGMQTVPGRILGFMHAGVDEMTAALSLLTSALLTGFVAVGVLLLWLPFRRKRSQ